MRPSTASRLPPPTTTRRRGASLPWRGGRRPGIGWLKSPRARRQPASSPVPSCRTGTTPSSCRRTCAPARSTAGPWWPFRPGSKRGANVRKAGEDVKAGETVLAEGAVLRPQDLAALASLGFGEAACFERLKVAIVSTGDEVKRGGGRARQRPGVRRQRADAGAADRQRRRGGTGASGRADGP